MKQHHVHYLGRWRRGRRRRRSIGLRAWIESRVSGTPRERSHTSGREGKVVAGRSAVGNLEFRSGQNIVRGDGESVLVVGAKETFSLGLGFTVLAAQLDIAAVGNEDSVSALIQMGVRW